MGSHHRITLFAALALSAACRKVPAPRPTTVTPAPSASASAPDRLAPGEVPPGRAAAYDLLLPAGSSIERKFGGAIHCNVPLPPETVANWIRSESDEAEALIGPSGTIFTKVRVRGAPAGSYLRIEVSPGVQVGDSAIVVDKLPDSPPPQVAPASNEEAMKKAGLTPDGKWLDPKHLE